MKSTVLPHAQLERLWSKIQEITRIWRKEPSTLLVKCKLVQPLWRTAWEVLKKLRLDLPYDPAIPLLDIYLKKQKMLIWKDTCTPMYVAALFTIAKIWKQSKCPSTDKWIKKMWCIYPMETTQPLKIMKFCLLQQHGQTRYAKWSKPEKDTYYISLTCGI